MYYSDEALQQLSEGYAAINGKHHTLLERFVTTPLKNIRAQEFARRDFPRRIKVMTRCIINVFDGIPLEFSELPSRDVLTDATINIQSFVFNVFGAVDNLAWIWVAEYGQKRTDGTPIPDGHVGLGPHNTAVRSTLSWELQNSLKALDPWFAHLANLRHALAHRIPLYIPPYVVPKRNEEAYRALDAQMNVALKHGNFEEYDRLSTEQLRLGHFRPWVQHSFEEKAAPVIFHAQMLADFVTVEKLAHQMLSELGSLRVAREPL